MSENSDFKRLRAYEVHYSRHPASPIRKPDNLSLDFEGIGEWQETQTPVSGDEEYPLDIGECDEDIEDLESPAQHGASPSSCIFINSSQQHINGPLTPITTPSRRGLSPRYPYLPRRRPNEIPPTPTHDEEDEGFHRDNLEQDSSVKSDQTHNESALQQPNHYYAGSYTSNGSAEKRRTGHFYVSSHRTRSHESRDSPDDENQSTGQPVQQPLSQNRTPQPPHPYSEWDLYDGLPALNEVQRF